MTENSQFEEIEEHVFLNTCLTITEPYMNLGKRMHLLI